MLLSKCVVANVIIANGNLVERIERESFKKLKVQEASGLLSSSGIKTLLIKIPLVGLLLF